MKNILWFKNLTKDDINKVGGKGANLGEMISHDIPVPPGFCVSVEAYRNYLDENNLWDEIKNELTDLNVEDTKKLNKASKKIKKVIISGEISQKLKKDILAAYRKLDSNFVAVRSSATAEDLPTASFAGQMATFLNIKGDKKLLKTIKKCWASLFEPRGIYYRETKGFDHLKVGIAVPVQKMVQSQVAGVMFTVDPVTNDESKTSIEAAYGLGEVVVSGSVNPDRYLINKKVNKLEDKNVARQTWTIKKKGGENKRVQIDRSKQEKQKLPDDKIIKLAEVGKRIEKHYKAPQDIEWAYDGKKLYIVQTRPVTTLKAKRAKKKVKHEGHRVLLKGSAASVGESSGSVKKVKNQKDLEKIEKGDVLVAEMTNPSYVPAMKRAAAIITDRGGQTSHAAIVSRELAIPCVVGTSTATKELEDGQIVTVSGDQGLVYEGSVAQQEEQKIATDLPDTKTNVYVNLSEPEAAKRVAKYDVDGVGLLRAEFMIADIGKHPKWFVENNQEKKFVKKLAQGIEKFTKSFQPRPIIYRGTDFKTNEYKALEGGEKYERPENNPMIGFRGAMRYISDPDVFKMELAAIKKIRKKYNNLHLMIPFVRTIEEMKKVNKIINEEIDDKDFKVYLMCEVPSTVILAQEFIDLGIEGFSIGSNDLTQLILGLDRDNERVAFEFDERNEAVKWALKRVIKICNKNGKSCSICGQAPSTYPEITEFLVKEGITSVSVNPDVIAKTKKLVADIEKRQK